MKKNFFLIITLLFIVLNTGFPQYKWSDITYNYETGSIPSPYYYEYDILISAYGDLTLIYYPDYGTPKNEPWKYELKLTEEQVVSLDSEIKNSKVLDEEICFVPPDNQSLWHDNLKITLYQDPTLDQTPTIIETPYFPTDPAKKKALDKLYELIKAMVPENIWAELKQKKDEYIQKNIK